MMTTNGWLSKALLVSTIALFVAAACASSEEMRRVRAEVAEADAACITCHADAARELDLSHHHGGLAHSVACLDCHFPHAGTETALGTAGLKARCEDCHADVAVQFLLPFRHTLGATITCTSCHSHHGAAPREEREHLRDDTCIGCHGEMRGPFVFKHEGDKLQACISCHEPHGSPNRRLLTHADPNSLCFSCHETLELSHSQSPGSPFIGCLHCHTEIHGSNWSAELFR